MQNFPVFEAKDILLSIVISYSFGVLFSILRIKSLAKFLPSYKGPRVKELTKGSMQIVKHLFSFFCFFFCLFVC